MARRPNSDTPLARQLSVGAVVDWIIHRGPVSRAAVAKATGLSKQTVSEVVRELELEGWVRPIGRTQPSSSNSRTTSETVCFDRPVALATAARETGPR